MTPGRAVLYAGFTLSGLMTVLLGVLVPELRRLYALGDGQAGAVFAVQFFAATAASSSYGWTAGRWPAARVAGVSYLILASGAACFLAGGLAAVWAGVAVYGVGLGLNIAAVNLAMALSRRGEAVRSLNLLNLFWGAGAVAGPAIISWALSCAPLPAVMGGLAIFLAAAGVTTLWLHRAQAGSPPGSSEPAGGAASRFPWLELIFLFLYVGAETCLSGWLPSLGQRRLNLSPPSAAAAQSLFWLGILAGRSLSAAWAGRAARSWMQTGLMLAAAGTALLLHGTVPMAFFAGACLAGLGLAPQFPTAVALYQQRAGASAVTWTGILFAGGGLGGAVMPWMLGLVSARTGSLTLAAYSVFLLLAVMFALIRPAGPDGKNLR